MRIPKNMIQDLESIAARTGRTRNEIISMCLEFALDHMDIADSD